MICLFRTANFSYLVSPLEAINARGVKDRTEVSWWTDDFNLDAAGVVVQAKDVAIVFVNSDSGEGPSARSSSHFQSCLTEFHHRSDFINYDGNEGDRKNLTAWHGGASKFLVFARRPRPIILNLPYRRRLDPHGRG